MDQPGTDPPDARPLAGVRPVRSESAFKLYEVASRWAEWRSGPMV